MSDERPIPGSDADIAEFVRQDREQARAFRHEACNQQIATLTAQLDRYKSALERVMTETGTSSLAHHAARDTLAPPPAPTGEETP